MKTFGSMADARDLIIADQRIDILQARIDRRMDALRQIRDLPQNNTGQTYAAMAQSALDEGVK